MTTTELVALLHEVAEAAENHHGHPWKAARVMFDEPRSVVVMEFRRAGKKPVIVRCTDAGLPKYQKNRARVWLCSCVYTAIQQTLKIEEGDAPSA